MRIFVSHPHDRLPHYFGDRAMTQAAEIAAVHYNPHTRELETAELVAAAQGCDVIIAYRQTPAPRELFASLPALAAFVRCAMDIRSVDVEAASAHGVLVTQASAGFVPAVAEWVIAAMLDLGRSLGGYHSAYGRGETPQPVMGRQLRGAIIGVVGYGRIARYLCELALALGMRVQVCDPNAAAVGPGIAQVTLPQLLSAADFVVCLAAAVPDTENLFDAAAFAAMRGDAFFINAARGELVDEGALLRALDSGSIAGCAMDVGRAADQMPSPVLARHPRVLATPHIGGLTLPAVEHQALETVEQVRSLLRGRLPAGAVNPTHASRLSRWGITLAPE